MNRRMLITGLLVCIPISFTQAQSDSLSQLLADYSTQGATTADAEQGKILWQKTFDGKGEFSRRSCTSCHTRNLAQTGKHIKTNKEIKPMAPVVNPQRLTDIKKIKKWFKRNCKWTIGRECTAQEKANILVYINNPSGYQE